MKAYTNSDLLKAMYIVDKLYDIARFIFRQRILLRSART